MHALTSEAQGEQRKENKQDGGDRKRNKEGGRQSRQEKGTGKGAGETGRPEGRVRQMGHWRAEGVERLNSFEKR